jgi:sodium/hydrogen antiporter
MTLIMQLPAKYAVKKWKELALLLLPVMSLIWLSTTLCLLATIPKITLLAGLAIAACVTCTDPVLSQAIAKGPFADMYVRRPLREIMSAEAGANDGFGYPFLTLATFLMRRNESPTERVPPEYHAVNSDASRGGDASSIIARVIHEVVEGVERQKGGVGEALRNWVVETWLYVVIMSVPYGALVGYIGGKVIKYCLRRKWIEAESYALFPIALTVS